MTSVVDLSLIIYTYASTLLLTCFCLGRVYLLLVQKRHEPTSGMKPQSIGDQSHNVFVHVGISTAMVVPLVPPTVPKVVTSGTTLKTSWWYPHVGCTVGASQVPGRLAGVRLPVH